MRLSMLYNKLLAVNHEIERSQGDDRNFWQIERNKLKILLRDYYERAIRRKKHTPVQAL